MVPFDITRKVRLMLVCPSNKPLCRRGSGEGETRGERREAWGERREGSDQNSHKVGSNYAISSPNSTPTSTVTNRIFDLSTRATLAGVCSPLHWCHVGKRTRSCTWKWWLHSHKHPSCTYSGSLSLMERKLSSFNQWFHDFKLWFIWMNPAQLSLCSLFFSYLSSRHHVMAETNENWIGLIWERCMRYQWISGRTQSQF